MNRHDEIQACARDIASNVHADPDERNAMADDLIKLIGLMINGVGKYVSVAGEVQMNEACGSVGAEACDHDDCNPHDASALMSVGERVESAATELSGNCQGVNLERYHEGPYGGNPVWVHVDRRPVMFRHMDARGALYIPPELAEANRCVECGRSGDFGPAGHKLDCSTGRAYSDLTGSTRARLDVVAATAATPSGGARCNECNRSPRFGHMIGCTRRKGAVDAEPGRVAERDTCCGGDAHDCVPLPGRCCYSNNAVCPLHH